MPLVATSVALFLLGGWFGYAVIFKYGFPYFLSLFSEQSQATLSISNYLSTVTRLLLAFGACFQLPVVVFFLSRMGVVNWRDLFRGFRYALVGIFAVSAFITPPDTLTQVLMAGPLTVLYVLGIGVAAVFSTKDNPG